MNRLSPLAVLLCAALLGPAVLAQDAKAPAKAPAKPVATVNGVAIPKVRADVLIAGQHARGAPDNADTQTRVREELIRREVISQEAKKKGLDKKPEVAAQMEMARQVALIQAYIQDYIRAHPISNEALKKEYDHVVARLGNKEYKARHILVEKEDEARAIIAKLKAGGKFEELAKQSKDPGSKEHGGELGWSSPANYVKPFSDAMVKLAKGQYTTEPVKSDFGYHVIQLDDLRERKLPSFEEAKTELAQNAQRQLIERHLNELRTKAKVE
ncbi:MAG: peptidylprolyl isomerase [Rhodocyclaceae bacterium]